MKPALAVTRRQVLWLLAACAGTRCCSSWALDLESIAYQPYFAGVNRAIRTLAVLGSPIDSADARQIASLAIASGPGSVETAEKILDRYTLATLSLDYDGSVQIDGGNAPTTLIEQGWRMFLVRVKNRAEMPCDISFAATATKFATPGNMILNEDSSSQRSFLLDTLNNAPFIERMWLLTKLHGATTQVPYMIPVTSLSGFALEYRVMQLFSRDRGRRRADLELMMISKGESTSRPSHAHRAFEFDCLPSHQVLLAIQDVDGRGCMASLIVRDTRGLTYPPQVMRIAPDMSFHPQIYRADGESLQLPDGEYTIESTRGPEYLRDIQTVVIDAQHRRIEVKLRRWIDPARWGWYSGDTHLHAAGCAHYQHPTEGVSPETMVRHVRGEGLSIGNVLSWGPSWYYQKQFFSGHVESPAALLEHAELQTANNVRWQAQPTPTDRESVLRYDVEVSGFPSSMCGHLVLLRLKEQDYPGTKHIEDWPSWNLPILRWARAQGAVAGYAHCGIGMSVESTDLPNYDIPPFDSIGANEALVDVTHGFVDFLSGCQYSPTAELNIWYHLLNCGFRLAMLGETDYPCISDERAGVGRSYVRLDRRPVDDAGYDAWIRGLQQGRLYCGDGRSHFLQFTVQGRRSGEGDVELERSGEIAVEATIAAYLASQRMADSEKTRTSSTNTWHVENARIRDTREIAVELVINGLPADRQTIVADGMPRLITFRIAILRSSWVALRILPSAHTHPVFVRVNKNPIRTSRRSARWCRASVNRLWEVKSPFMRESERPAAAEAFDHARKAYEAILAECDTD